MNLFKYLILDSDDNETVIMKYRSLFQEAKLSNSTTKKVKIKSILQLLQEYSKTIGESLSNYQPSKAYSVRSKIAHELRLVFSNPAISDDFLVPEIAGIQDMTPEQKNIFLGKSDITGITVVLEVIRINQVLAIQNNSVEHLRDICRLKFVQQLISSCDTKGLHPLIWQRQSKDWRYNIILMHPVAETHYAINLSFNQIQRSFVYPFHEKENYIINGRTVYSSDVEQIRITTHPLKNVEIPNFLLLKNCKSDLSFASVCTDVTNDFVQNKFDSNTKTIWSLLHPIIQETVLHNINTEDYLSALRKAVTLLHNEVKNAVSVLYPDKPEMDGTILMEHAFSPKNPIFTFSDLNTKSGADIQKGYKELFVGVISAIRNPLAHANKDISESECMEQLILISHLLKVFNSRVIAKEAGI